MAEHYHLNFIGIYEYSQPINMFIQHIHSLVHVRVEGVVTLGKLKNAFQEKWNDSPEKLEAATDFYKFQLENGLTDETVICGESDEESCVFHFDLMKLKQK